MALTVTEIQQLYTAYLDRPVDRAGLEYWQQQDITAGQLRSYLANDEQPEYVRIYGNLTRSELVTTIYQNMFNREPDAEGLDYWVTGTGSSVPASQLQQLFIEAAAPADRTTFNAEVATDEANIPDGGGTPSNPGETYVLTAGRDNVTGTDADDTFFGDVGQNDLGAVSNALSSGDVLNGGAGTDSLVATLINDNQVDGADANISINARTESIEEVYLGVLDENVVVDAGRMNAVQQFWSDDSDASAIIEDVRLGDGQSITRDITFGMRDVDQQSGLFASFETQSLISAPSSQVNSQLEIRIADVSTETPETPLANVNIDLSFNLGAERINLSDVRSTDGSYAGLATAINTALEAAGYGRLSVELSDSYEQVTVAGNTVNLPFTAREILVTDPNGQAISNVSFTQAAIEPVDNGFLVAGNAEPVDPSVATNQIETNLVLDNAGRGSTAGDAVIGGMSNSGQVIEKLNLVVDRNSRIDDLATASGMEDADVDDAGNMTVDYVGFQEIELTSQGANGILSINNIQDTDVFNASAFQGASLTIGNADSLLTLDANIAGNVTANVATEIGDNVYTTGAGTDNLTVAVDGDDVDTAGESLTISTNAGNDSVTVNMPISDQIAGAAPNANGVSFETMDTLDNLDISTGAGDDSVTLNGYGTFDIETGGGSDFVHINSLLNGVDLPADSADVLPSQNGNATNGNWTIGDTSDAQNLFFDERVLYNAQLTVNFAGFEQTVTVQTSSSGNFIATQETINNAIKAAIDANPELSRLLEYSDSTGNQALDITSLIGGDNNLGIAIYQPQLVGSNAEDGQTVLSEGDLAAIRQGLINTNYVPDSTGLDTREAIIGATDQADDNFFGSVGTAGTDNVDATLPDRDLNYQSDGTTQTNDDVQGDVTAGPNQADTSGGIFQDAGVFYQALDNGGSSNSTTGFNFSSINVGSGSNDLVVLHSRDLSSNQLVIDQQFGKVSVVNWFTTSSDAVNSVASMGEHALDFSSYLDNQIDPSVDNGNSASVRAVNTTVNLVSGASSYGAAVSPGVQNDNNAEANTVNVIRFAENAEGTQTFASLTGSGLLNALNGANGNTGYGNLNDELLEAVATANLVGNTQDHIVMVENNLNEGEYKVFYLTSTIGDNGQVANGDFASATELGTLDFGASINFNVVGNEFYDNYLEALKTAVDNGETSFSYQGPNDTTVNVDIPGNTIGDGDDDGDDSPVPGTVTAELTEDTGSSTADGITSNAALDVSGASEGATVEYRIQPEGGDFGDWGDYTAPTADGGYTVEVRQVVDGQNSEATEVSFTLDTTDPAANGGYQYTDVDGNGAINTGDTVEFAFSEAVQNLAQESLATEFGTDASSAVNASTLTVTLGTGAAFDNTGEVTLTGVTDVAGNSADVTFTV